MTAASPVLRTLSDLAGPALLTSALFLLYWVDSHPTTAASNVNQPGLLDLPTSPAENEATIPAERLDGSGDRLGPAIEQPTAVVPTSVEPTTTAESVSGEHEPIFGMVAKPLPETFTASQVLTFTMPAAPPVLPERLERPKQTEQVSFFKLEAKASAVVFVVDASGSMYGHKFERAQAELARAIGELNSHQSFAVAFFNHSYAFMPISNNRRPTLTKATFHAKEQAISLMQQAHASGGTHPEPALIAAAELRPEVVFLLTDGEFHPLSSQTFGLLAEHRTRVFTVGFDTTDTLGTLQFIANQTAGLYRAATTSDAPHEMFLAKSSAIFVALDDADPKIRLAAAVVAFSREMTHVRRSNVDEDKTRPAPQELSFVHKLPLLLKDPDDRVRREVHHRLILKALGTNFGPVDFSNAADVESSVELWSRFCAAYFEHDRSRVLQGLASDDPAEQWLNAAVVRIAGWNVPDDLTACLGQASSNARRELRAALSVLSDGQDFGPESTDSDEQIAQAVAKWKEWHEAKKRRLAQEQKEAEEKKRIAALQKRIDEAATRMRVAEMNWKSGKTEKARTIWEKVTKEYPDTPSAIEAEKRLQANEFP